MVARTHDSPSVSVRKVGMSPLLQFSGARNRFCMYIRIVPCLFSMSAQISRTPREREWSGREMQGKSCSSSDSPLDCYDAHHLGTQRKCRERRCRQPSLFLYPAICINRRGSSFIRVPSDHPGIGHVRRRGSGCYIHKDSCPPVVPILGESGSVACGSAEPIGSTLVSSRLSNRLHTSLLYMSSPQSTKV